MSPRGPPILTAVRYNEFAERLAGAEGLVVGLDFDGTLAPIADDPDKPSITPACRRALEMLEAHPRVMAIVISGREISDLRERVGVSGIVYAGNHGLELRRGDRTETHGPAAHRRPAVRRAIGRIADGLAGVPGWEIEDKGLTATVHVRRTRPELIDRIRSMVEAAVREEGDRLRIASGKQVFEVRPALDWDKGSVIEYLSEDAPDGWRTVYLGDDVTDEDAFRAVRPDGIGVLVGSREGSDADYRIPTQAAVAPFLDWLVNAAIDRCSVRS